jgi:hypothetical protein
VLSALALDIQQRETKLSDIRLRERRSTLLVTLYALAAWAAYVSLWYLDLIPVLSRYRHGSKVEKAVKGALVIVGPVMWVLAVSSVYGSAHDRAEYCSRGG